MNISQPVASYIGSVNFGFLSSAEIRALSVKKIQNPDTFDTLLHPTPGGLYDSALGAWGDNSYVFCHPRVAAGSILSKTVQLFNMLSGLFLLSRSPRPYRIASTSLPCVIHGTTPEAYPSSVCLLLSIQARSNGNSSLYMQTSFAWLWSHH